MKTRLLYLLTFVLCGLNSFAIEPTWSVDVGSVFDNREGDTKYTKAETFFFITLAPEVGLKITEQDRIAGGCNWTQPLENKFGKVKPTIYYRHDGEKWKFSMGLFPRTQLREPLPGFLWCDSLNYFQKNVRGALIQYDKGTKGFFDAYIDWRGLQSETTREAFNIMFHGEVRPKNPHFLVGAHVLMNHFAKSKNASEDQHVVDNFLVNPYVGVDYSRSTVLDSLVVKLGVLQTIERNRAQDKWDCPGGLWLDGTFEWKMLGAKNSLYLGRRGLLPIYGEFGSLLYQGEPFYQSKFYDRLDLYGHVYRNKFIDVQAQLNFNFAKGSFIFYQRLTLVIYLGNL